MVAGTTSLGLLVLLAWHFSPDTSPAQLLAMKASRVDLVGQMQLALVSGAEAEKSAVLAVTDEDAQASADQARAAAAQVERGLVELGRQLAARGTARERELLASFTDAFAAQQRIDGELLDLAVRNSNSKASALAFGPAADAAGALDAALSRENTDVRSLALSLSKKRRATVLCLEALAALQQAVLDEPIPGVSYGNLPNPRR